MTDPRTAPVEDSLESFVRAVATSDLVTTRLRARRRHLSPRSTVPALQRDLRCALRTRHRRGTGSLSHRAVPPPRPALHVVDDPEQPRRRARAAAHRAGPRHGVGPRHVRRPRRARRSAPARRRDHRTCRREPARRTPPRLPRRLRHPPRLRPGVRGPLRGAARQRRSDPRPGVRRRSAGRGRVGVGHRGHRRPLQHLDARGVAWPRPRVRRHRRPDEPRPRARLHPRGPPRQRDGLPVYERLGFVEVCRVPQFVWAPTEPEGDAELASVVV